MSEPVIGENIAAMQDQARQIGDLGARRVLLEAARDAEYQRAESEHAAHVETMQERDEARASLFESRALVVEERAKLEKLFYASKKIVAEEEAKRDEALALLESKRRDLDNTMRLLTQEIDRLANVTSELARAYSVVLICVDILDRTPCDNEPADFCEDVPLVEAEWCDRCKALKAAERIGVVADVTP